MLRLMIAAMIVVPTLGMPAPTAAATCERLSALSLPNATITAASSVTSGAFTIPASTVVPNQAAAGREISGLPPFCRVAATLTPSRDSDITIEVWMPLSDWNHRFLGVGNGGRSGAISYGAMVPALKAGYAVTSTDTGHQSAGNDAAWAMGHPEKQIDFGYRAVHEMTVRAKAIVEAFYGAAPQHAYWNGCSSGGKQGLKEAQEFPEDYDGIVAGAPANAWTRLSTSMIAVAQVAAAPGGAIPETKYPLIHRAVLQQCDRLDGVEDGLLENPARCPFNPGVLQCKDGDSPTCLTGPQVATLKRAYAPTRSAGGGTVFPGLAMGGERGWGRLPQPFAIGESHYKYVVFADPAWDFRTFDVDRDLAKADAIDRTVGHLNATDPNLDAFRKRGGKIIQYHGWNDQQISPQNSIDYHETVVSRLGDRHDADEFYRLFMVPGMMHCRGGEGATDRFDALAAVAEWVEHGIAPSTINASSVKDGSVKRTRPLCPYPLVARWSGSGNPDEASTFACVADR